MRFILSALLAAGLAGCGMIQQYQFDHLVAPAGDQRNNEEAACKRQYPDAYAKPTLPRAACLRNVAAKYRSAVGDPNTDLGSRLDAEMVLASENYDAGKLTAAQFDLARADAIANSTTAAHQRSNGASSSSSNGAAAGTTGHGQPNK
jgi:hypothetical protein